MTADPVVDLCLMLVEASDADRQAQSAARALLVAWEALERVDCDGWCFGDTEPCWRCATRNRIVAIVEGRDA